jgi:hypothetical protein
MAPCTMKRRMPPDWLPRMMAFFTASVMESTMAFMEGTLGVVMFVYLAGTPAMCKDSGKVSGEVSVQLPSCSRKEVG